MESAANDGLFGIIDGASVGSDMNGVFRDCRECRRFCCRM
jgi:hypothetical protein